jgi:hypothetical protein
MEYNHKVKSIEFYGYEDVYNINVAGIHNFAVGAGIIIKNSYHKDPTFIAYLLDKFTDMHRDQALDIWKLNREDLVNEEFDKEQNGKAKKVRFYAKNLWTFAQFYGDWYDSCARNLWETCIEKEKLVLPSGITLLEHCNANGLYCVEDLIEHCKGVEYRLWNEKFPVYTKWKKNISDFYKKNGFIETYFGFRFIGYMDRKQCTNYPIQGCLQGHSKVLTKKGWKRIDNLVGKKVEVWTGFAWKNATGINRGKCTTASVILESGLKLDCDTRHEFKNQNNEWVKFKDLKINDYVALPKVMSRDEYKYKIDWPFILGFSLGDGWFGSKKLTKNNTRYVMEITGGKNKKQILEDILLFMGKYVQKGFPQPRIKQTGENKWTLHLEGKKMAELFEERGYTCDMNAHTKHIPDFIWEGSKKQQRSFMEGLWLSDGSRKRKSLHMCNEALLKEVQVLLFGLGYDSFIKKTGNGWKLTPQCILSEGHTSRMYPRDTLNNLLNGRTVPFDIDDTTTTTDRRNLAHNKDCNQKMSERIINRVCSEFVELYRYDRVVDIIIDDSEEETFTMSVDDDLHQFVADGIICKNTSFHLLVYTLMEVEKFIKKYDLKTKIIGQIHDSIISDVPVDEIDFYHRGVSAIVSSLNKKFKWLTVEMEAECSISKPRGQGGNFSDLYDIKPKFLNGEVEFDIEKIYGKEA